MNAATYTAIITLLATGVLFALVVMVFSLIAIIVQWKTAKRRGHVKRLLIAIATIPCLIGIQQAVLWLVFLPGLSRQQLADLNALRADRLVKTSVVHVGDPAPQFSLNTADDEEFSLAEGTGDVVLINFFATWCGPCLMELPHIEEIWAARKHDKNFRMLVIGREETIESVRNFRDENGFSFPIAADPDRAVFSLFASESIPRTLLVSPNGVIVYSKSGFAAGDPKELNQVLKEQLSGLQ